MVPSGRRRSIAFIALGGCIVAAALALNISWVLLNWRTGVMLIFGIIFFVLIISGVVLNTIFLVREIRRNEQHNNFINAVTHELKTPVASIRLYLQTLQTRSIDEARRQQFYQIMLDDSDRLLGTIEQVLRAGTTSAMSRKLNILPVNVVKLVDECLALARTRHHLTTDALEYSTDLDGEAVVMGDTDELKAAVSNLIDNAIKYSGPQVKVKVEVTQPEHQQVAIRVRDQGVGIPRDELKRIFKRFYRIPGSVALRVKGTGLGLFIVRSVAERHGGRAYAESEGSGCGSTFTLQLPLAQP